jgi:hypothetical protein
VTGYRELRIRLEPAAEAGTYELFAQGPSGEVSGSFKLPWPDVELENFVLKLGRSRQGVRRVDSPEFALARRVGCELFEALFAQEVRDLYRGSFEQARAEGKGLRVTLALAHAPELMHVPWEYLCDDRDFLSISTQTPVVRYLDLPTSRRPLAVALPLRILALVSSPSDVVALDVSRERAKLEDAVEQLTATGAVEIQWLEEATLPALQRALRRQTFHIFHYIGHGGYDSRLEDGVLLLEDDQGRSRHASGLQLGAMLADHASLRLAVLNACEGARTSREDAFSGVATSLVRREIPAVIAMQFEITDRAAIVFAGEFYAALADGYPVDAALAEARKAIFADQNDVEWATPVLFMRVAEGKIFDIPPGAASALAPTDGRARPEVDEERPHEEAEDDTRAPPPPKEEPAKLPVAVFLVALAAILLIALGNIFPWDNDDRSFLNPLFDDSATWVGNVLTSLSPFAIVAGVLMTLPALRQPGPGLTTAGLLIGFGLVGVAKYFGVLGRAATLEEPRAMSVFVFFLATIAAASLVAIGTVVARTAPDTPEPGGRDSFVWLGAPALVMGAILILIGTVIPFNNGGPAARDSHTIFPSSGAFDALAAAAVAVAVLIPAVRPRRALLGGLLLAVGIESVTLWLRYVGVPIVEDRDVASPAVGGFSGLLGAMLVLAAGCLALWSPQLGRARARTPDAPAADPRGPPA